MSDAARRPGPPPAWFTAAMASFPECDELTVHGCRIALERWDGPDGASPVVLVHGGAANAGWWRALAPLLAADRRVVAMDLSGHGGSGWREHYAFDGWADEVLAVAEVAGSRRAVLCGHSMGGIVAAVAAARGPGSVAAIVLVDTPLAGPDPVYAARLARTLGTPRRYESEVAARASFRLLPQQPIAHPQLLSAVAARSIRQVDRGWTWRFDPAAFAEQQSDRPADLMQVMDASAAPVWTIIGDASSTVSHRDRARMEDRAHRRGGAGNIVLPHGHHHLMFDQPLALLAGLRRALEAIDMPRGA